MSTNTTNDAPRHSIAEIQSAIEALMSRLSGGRAADATLAGRIASTISPTVNDPHSPIDVLTGPAFDRLVIEHAPKLAETINDPATKLAAAKAEEARANISGAPLSEAARAALYGNGFQGGASRTPSGDRGGDYGSGRAVASADVASITPQNYAGSSFAASGLSYEAFNSMRKEGFNDAQIKAAVNTNKALGIGVNDNPAATARLNRDTPWAVNSLKESHDALKEADDCDEKAKAAEAKGDTAGAETWRKKAEEKRKSEDENHRKTRERMEKEKPERLPDYDDRYQRMHDNLHTGNEHADKARLSAFEEYRRHPDDAAARRNYKQALASMKEDPKLRSRTAELEQDVRDSQKAEAEKQKENRSHLAANVQTEQRNDVKAADNAAQAKAGDANLDLLNDAGDKSAAKAADATPATKDKNSGSDKPADKKKPPTTSRRKRRRSRRLSRQHRLPEIS